MIESAPVSEPIVARPKPYLVQLKAGQVYFWCRCGRSRNQPFCDGSHKGTGLLPLKHVGAVDGEEVLFCGCKQTRGAPFCDGAHTNLPGGALLDDPNSEENRKVPLVAAGADGRAHLDGGCQVCTPQAVALETRGGLSFRQLIASESGAQYQALYYLRVAMPGSPVFSCGDRHAVLMTTAGRGSIVISGERFSVRATDGIYVRPGEAMQLVPDAGQVLECVLSIAPLGTIEWLDSMPANFDSVNSQRVASVDPAQRSVMGPRYFQCLVDKTLGSDMVTQFIGHIPYSKAAPHRHLYEETLIVLSGEGCMWTESRKATVRAGDVIFLPRKQVHSLQCTAENGMDVAGVIYPGDNPSINY
ncbi:MAG: CDGSH iron-sulfur domain-containing protein [Pseudomonadales bacterium]|nr:CDGSH iron-sulfur domain-containing protein [Pseudomonadales bacterium]